jgi:hypothetical protein
MEGISINVGTAALGRPAGTKLRRFVGKSHAEILQQQLVPENASRQDPTQRFCSSQILTYAALAMVPIPVPVTLRTASDSITRETPLMIMLMPTRVPIAHAELDGHWT